jgi:cysteine desulfurase
MTAVARIYLDDAGSAPILPEVRRVLDAGLAEGNPSSPHAEGRQARAQLDGLRDAAAAAMDVSRNEITFVSSGTEAVNLALFGAAARLPRNGRVLTWAAEHQAVLASVRRLQDLGHEVVIAPVDATARIDPDAITPGTALVSVGLANNEVGTVQPVADVIERAHSVGALVHVDACAGPRWMPIPKGADLLSISGHKIGAGRGGLLFVRDGVRIDPLFFGGPQEWGRRGGHEDIHGAAAVTAALLVVSSRIPDVCSQVAERQSALLRSALVDAGGTLTGDDHRLPNFATCTFRGRRGEDLLMALDMAGVAASSGSACASGSLDPSHVLLAMGLTLEEALGSLRLTTGWGTTDEDIFRASEILRSVLSRAPSHA